MTALSAIGGLLLILSVIFLATFVLRILFVPLAIAHEVADWNRRLKGKDGVLHATPTVTVVVPAYNEEAVLESCVSSIISSGYPALEIIIVSDGSTDATADIGARLAAENPQVRFVHQTNAGKGAALNNGYRKSSGEFLMFVDADSVFTPDTVPEMLRAFRTDDIGAVCGDDRPVNLDRIQTRFLALITYVGTGLVRRAFDVLRCVPVISGNCGTFRCEALEAVSDERGPFREDTIGEDLELTWRLHRSQWRVAFAPHAVVFAESPSTARDLWKQRVRWARGLLQGIRHHADALVNWRRPIFSVFLWFTVVTMVVVPISQIGLSIAAVWAVIRALVYGTWDALTVGIDVWAILAASGLGLSLALLLISMALSNALYDLRHIWTAPVWPLYSLAMSFTIPRALWLEVQNRPNVWNKPQRTGVISTASETTLTP